MSIHEREEFLHRVRTEQTILSWIDRDKTKWNPLSLRGPPRNSGQFLPINQSLNTYKHEFEADKT